MSSSRDDDILPGPVISLDGVIQTDDQLAILMWLTNYYYYIEFEPAPVVPAAHLDKVRKVPAASA